MWVARDRDWVNKPSSVRPRWGRGKFDWDLRSAEINGEAGGVGSWEDIRIEATKTPRRYSCNSPLPWDPPAVVLFHQTNKINTSGLRTRSGNTRMEKSDAPVVLFLLHWVDRSRNHQGSGNNNRPPTPGRYTEQAVTDQGGSEHAMRW